MKKMIGNFTTLFTGTLGSQLIPLLITPILTRLYLPEQFAAYSIYVAIVTILYVFVTGRYELAILNTDKMTDTNTIVFISLVLSVLINFVLFLILVIFGSEFSAFIGNDEIEKWLYFIPLTLVYMSIQQTTYLYFNKFAMYKNMSINLFSISFSIALFNLIIGFSNPELGLIAGYIAGHTFSTLIITLQAKKINVFNFKSVNRGVVLRNLKSHINFPKYLILSHLFNRTSIQAPIILFTKFYNENQVGNYSIAHRILKTPIGMVGNVVGQIFRQKASLEIREQGNCLRLYMQTFLTLIVVGFAPFLVLYLYSNEIFIFILGNKWELAGEYIKIMIPMLYMQFCIAPLSSLFLFSNNQRIDLLWQITTFFLVVFTIILTNVIYQDLKASLYGYTFAYCAMYFISFLLTIKIAKGKSKITD